VRTIPPEDRDWMLKGAVFVRYAVLLTLPLSHLQILAMPPYERNDHCLEPIHCTFGASKSAPSSTAGWPRPNTP